MLTACCHIVYVSVCGRQSIYWLWDLFLPFCVWFAVWGSGGELSDVLLLSRKVRTSSFVFWNAYSIIATPGWRSRRREGGVRD